MTRLPSPQVLILPVLNHTFVSNLLTTDLADEEGNVVRFVRVEGKGVERVGEVGGEGQSIGWQDGLDDDSSPAYNVLNVDVTEIQSDTYTYKLASWICLSSAYLCND